jgi:hypothetical protein
VSAKSRKAVAVLTEDLQAHPAVRAWRAATSVATTPASIQVLRERRKSLYRLPGLAPDGTAVIAKRAVAPRTLLERTVYEQILPRLPLTTPHYYGSWLDGADGWLFLEDVGAHQFSRHDPQHRAIAARWVATLHAHAAGLPAAKSLPDGGPARYLQHLRAAREEILRSVGAWGYASHEIELLDSVLTWCDRIEERWTRVESGCARGPATVVHGDFQSKNAFLRGTGGGISLFPIDWEQVGYGPPATDLTRIDLDAYWVVARHAWPDMTFDGIARLADLGLLFDLLAWVRWESASLKCDDAHARSWAVTSLGQLLGPLEEAARRTGVLE